MGGGGRKKVLLLCNYYPGAAGAIIDHIMSFPKFSENDYYVLSILGDFPSWLDLSRFDALIFHYSLIAAYDSYISPVGRAKIREFSGFKAAFVQDDYRWIDDTVDALAYMGIHALFPLTGPEIIDEVYSPKKLPGVRKVTVLAGYVPKDLVSLAVKPYAQRSIDVGYRARKLPAWMGSHTLQKWQIAEAFLSDASRYGLTVDISCREEDRIYGDSWINFLTNSKATLGTESGASVCDFTGTIQRNVEAHLARDPHVTFDRLRELYFSNDDCKIMMNVISPRCFEAAALRTLMVLYEGYYSGVLIPWRHYVPLKRDHSNMDEVVRILRSPNDAERIIQQAYDEVANNRSYSYEAMVELVDKVMNEEWRPSFVPAQNPYRIDEFEWLVSFFPPFQSWQSKVVRDDVFGVHAKAVNIKTRSVPKIGHVSELALERKLNPKAIAIRWDTNHMLTPRSCDVYGICEGKISAQWKNVYSNGSDFVLLDATSRKAIDGLWIYSPNASAYGKVLELAVLGLEPTLLMRALKRYKASLLNVALKVWNTLPAPARLYLKPVARFIRSALKLGGA